MVFHLPKAILLHIILSYILHFPIIQKFIAGCSKCLLIAEFKSNYRSAIIQTHFAVIINSLPVISVKTSLIQNIEVHVFCSTVRNSKFLRSYIFFFVFFWKRAKIIINNRLMFFQLRSIPIKKIRLVTISSIYIIILSIQFYNIPCMPFCTSLRASRRY